MVLAAAEIRGEQEFLLRPNRSLTGRQVRAVYFFQAGLGLGIAGGFVVLELWPILPFAGLELIALGACLYLCGADAQRRQVVRVLESTVVVAKSNRGRTWSREFPRGWAQVRLLRPAVDWYPSRLIIESHGKSVTVGEFLTEEERVRLAVDLGRAMAVRPFEVHDK